MFTCFALNGKFCSLPFITNINFNNIIIVLNKTKANRSVTINNRKILALAILFKTEVENVIPPTKARMTEANIPRIDTYSFSTPCIVFPNPILHHQSHY